MIISPFTVIILFASVITGLLSLVILLISLSIYKKTEGPIDTDIIGLIEDRTHILLLSAMGVFIIKLLLWPFFYVTLQSYIPHVPGAMCVFGVTQVQPILSSTVQISKPVVFFLIGSWFILNRMDERSGKAVLDKRRALFLSGASLVSLSDSFGDILYFTNFKIKSYVACCTTLFDIPEKRVSASISSLFLGERYQGFIMPAYYVSNILLIFMMAINLVYFTYRKRYSPCLVSTEAIYAIFNAVVTIIATFESIAPSAMKMPDHHCIYCLWQYTPLSILFTASFIIGTYSPLWAGVIQLFRHDNIHSEIAKTFTKRLYLTGVSLTGINVTAVMIQRSVYL